MAAKRRLATKQEIADSFEALSLGDQEDVLSELGQIHRIVKRLMKQQDRTNQRLRDDLQDVQQQVQKRRIPESITAPLPTEWLTAPDLALQQRIAGDTTPEDHEH